MKYYKNLKLWTTEIKKEIIAQIIYAQFITVTLCDYSINYLIHF